MNIRGAAQPPRWRSVIAVAAVFCVLSALVGSWAVRNEAATSASPSSVAASHDGAGDAIGITEVDVETVGPAVHFDCKGPSATNERSFKTAGIKRDRPPTWSRSAPPEWWLSTPVSLNTAGRNPHAVPSAHSPVPARTLAGQELLNHIGVARC